MTRVTVEPSLLRWARDRARLDIDQLTERFPMLRRWELGEVQPTLRQLEQFARVTRAPIGYLFLDTPPTEAVPIPDFRTIQNAHIAQPSPDLLETVYLCEQRQEWYRAYARAMGEDALPFVGSVSIQSEVASTASSMRAKLQFDVDRRSAMNTWTEALREFIGQADDAGILVMCSGIVGNNTHRKLDPQEFRGFALSDQLAPVVFINGADTRSAQMFTLAHELAHVWLGQSALSDSDAREVPERDVERWCNEVGAELLVPINELRNAYRPDVATKDEVGRLARRFKVSTLVILRRIFDVGGLTREELRDAYDAEVEHLRSLPGGTGGNFYLTLPSRVSKRFARAIVASTLEGQTLYRDAARMLGFSKSETFDRLGRSLGIIA